MSRTTDDTDQLRVMVDEHLQFSLWPATTELPSGWTCSFGPAPAEACRAYLAASNRCAPSSLHTYASRPAVQLSGSEVGMFDATFLVLSHCIGLRQLFAIWPDNADIPDDWTTAYGPSTTPECQKYIDSQPQSLPQDQLHQLTPIHAARPPRALSILQADDTEAPTKVSA